jgi:hypothetical protein
MESEGKPTENKEWVLDPETEYRFELDPGTSLAIKVCSEALFVVAITQVFPSMRICPAGTRASGGFWRRTCRRQTISLWL